MNRKYLDEIGDTCRWDNGWGEPLDEKEAADIQKAVDRCGVDPRECFNLDVSFYEWLYERLMRYKQDASKVVTLGPIGGLFEFKGAQFSQEQMIDGMLERLRLILSDKIPDVDEEDKACREVGEMWAIVLPAMWW